MITILLAVVIGILFTMVATENVQVVSMSLFGTVFSLPFYLYIALSFLGGAIIATLFSVFDWTKAAFDIKKKESSYNNILRINETLKNDIQKIYEENQSLKQEVKRIKDEEQEKKNLKRKESIKNFFAKIVHPSSHPAEQLS